MDPTLSIFHICIPFSIPDSISSNNNRESAAKFQLALPLLLFFTKLPKMSESSWLTHPTSCLRTEIISVILWSGDDVLASSGFNTALNAKGERHRLRQRHPEGRHHALSDRLLQPWGGGSS